MTDDAIDAKFRADLDRWADRLHPYVQAELAERAAAARDGSRHGTHPAAAPGGVDDLSSVLDAAQARMAGAPSVEKTPGVCGGAARVAGTRVPVWQLAVARRVGATEAQILADYPALSAAALSAAWDYAAAHPAEIEAEIQRNADHGDSDADR